jgi:hypothetical protein|tara:strand:- start:430 stop:579 length:150 start_codon:yes stop_codon:yes gene_type:complete
MMGMMMDLGQHWSQMMNPVGRLPDPVLKENQNQDRRQEYFHRTMNGMNQ